MTITATTALATIDAAIATYGEPIQIDKYVDGAANAFGQRRVNFGTAVVLQAAVSIGDNAEVRTMIGDGGDFDGSATISRTSLLEKFPSVEPEVAIGKEDQLTHDGISYKITSVHPTGRVSGVMTIFVVVFEEYKGGVS